MNTQTTSNIGLKGKKPKNLFFLFPFSAQGPNPKRNGSVDFGCHLTITHRTSMHYFSFFHAYHFKITSLLPISLTLGHKHTHTHTTKISQILSRLLKNSPSSPLQKSRKLGAFKRILQVNHHLR